MKLHRLELTGFGPFRERQTVDFDAFDRDGVFLISGRTGAGKSSILDGVSFALYGSVPRYESGERRLRSDHSFLGDPTDVRLEFTVGDRRWRVTRAPDYERPAKRGDKLTTEPARAELDELVGGTWVGRAAKPREVGLLLDEVLGLNAQQFQQVILLAQNKFSRFLLARNDERQQLLRTLFGTRRFEQYKDDLEQRRRAAQRELEAAGDQTRTLLELAEAAGAAPDGRPAGEGEADDRSRAHPRPADLDLAARRDAVVRAHQRALYAVEQAAQLQEQADAEHVRVAAAHAELVDRVRTLDDLASARARMDRLDADAPSIAADSRRIERARTAEVLRATLEVAERAEAAVATARADVDGADERWRDAGGDLDGDLAATVEALTGDIARWTDAAARERELIRAAADREACERSAADLAAQLAGLDEQHSRVPAERERLEAEHATASVEAARVDDLRTRRDELAAQSEAASTARRLADDLAAAETSYLEASARADAAGAAVTELLRRRFAGRAAELAAELVDGERCPVCGAVEHPHPAPAARDLVTDDDLAGAEHRRDIAVTAAQTAGERAAGIRAEQAAAAARAAGRTVDDLAAASAVAAEALDRAVQASTRATELTAQRAALDELDAAASVERDRLGDALARAREQMAATSATVARLEKDVAEARGDAATVADRLAAAREHRDLVRAALEARSRLAERERAAQTALADRFERVAASDFDDPDAVRAALVPATDLASLENRLAEHTADVSATRARLLELELAAAGLGDERPDLEASSARVAAADAARGAAIAAHRDAVHATDRLRDLLVRIDESFAVVAERAESTAAVTRLADTVAGRAPNTRKMDLETFVLAAELEEIVAAANLRLRDMSSGRYTLHHSDALQARGAASGLALEVLDAHTGRLRSPQSLSGGETFLASLALALGLAEVVTGRAGGIRLDTLFVDEGFGSLDPETLELAMRTLDELRAGGRTVGVISHVEGMKEQLAAQIVVEATREGPSIIRQDARSDDR
ncbi:AAA family ATPase [Microbacterium oleivorans]|uniref:Nuclease SbcCD subunit C n=1 Tax=Microbacterium oleivorans TaxID=273677 RepID=A0A7D5IS57_9MICO|nr:SMC family ATPase [Microbacterium oleivorans]QLD11277.1 SMC family ATPase [Microbacterium oleivorans]